MHENAICRIHLSHLHHRGNYRSPVVEPGELKCKALPCCHGIYDLILEGFDRSLPPVGASRLKVYSTANKTAQYKFMFYLLVLTVLF